MSKRINKLRIFVDCHVLDGPSQGTTTYLKGLYTELIKHSEIDFILAAYDVVKLQLIFGIHDNVTYVKYSSHNKMYRLLVDIPRLIIKFGADYAHFQYIVPPVKFCKYIVTIHDVLFLDFPQYFPSGYKLKNKLLFGASAKLSDIVVTVSPYSQKRIAEHFKIANSGITPNGIDPVYFQEYNKDEVRKLVESKYNLRNFWLYVSRREPRKNHLSLLRAFVEEQYYREYQLVFVGAEALRDNAYDAYWNGLDKSVQERVISLHRVNSDDLPDMVRASSLSVYPSYAEGFGIPPLESLAAGIPTICSNSTAMADFTVFENFAFNPYDLSELKTRIKMALANPDVMAKRQRVLEQYTWELSARNYLERLYSDDISL